MLISSDQVDRIIKYVGVLTTHPKMVTGKDDDVEAANLFIGSVRFALIAVFDLPMEWLYAYEDALINRGHKFNNHVYKDLEEKGYASSEIVKELGFIELEMWRIIRDSLEK
jgi:hypothetical protein